MYEYTLREQALWKVLASVYPEHPNQELAISRIEELLAQMTFAEEKRRHHFQLALRQEIELIKSVMVKLFRTPS